MAGFLLGPDNVHALVKRMPAATRTVLERADREPALLVGSTAAGSGKRVDGVQHGE